MNHAKFVFSSIAEQWNGRLAMMGFVIGLGTELLTGQGILNQMALAKNWQDPYVWVAETRVGYYQLFFFDSFMAVLGVGHEQLFLS